tara:strand:+ start:247 stop:429 length:183 start_codon:yes stop_codon:yes gene_type:complete
MNIRDKNGSKGQNGIHNSNDDDKLKNVSISVKNACEYRLTIDIARPMKIRELPMILLIGL